MENREPDNNKLINYYLENEDLLYKKWYIKKTAKETGIEYGEPIGIIDDYKKAFKIWLDKNRSSLVKMLCPHKETILRELILVEIVKQIAMHIKNLPEVAGVYETASLIFVYGLEKLCKEYEG